MGWPVDVATHHGWGGNLQNPELCPSILYYADMSVEVCIIPLLPFLQTTYLCRVLRAIFVLAACKAVNNCICG